MRPLCEQREKNQLVSISQSALARQRGEKNDGVGVVGDFVRSEGLDQCGGTIHLVVTE